MAQEPRTRRASRDDLAETVAAVARAFHDDPIWSWIFPDDATRVDRIRRTFGVYADVAMRRGEVHTTPDRSAGSFWLAPDEWRTKPSDIARGAVPLLRAFGTRLPRALKLLHEVESRHPKEPHWYLQVLGTDPPARGHGLGGALITTVTDRCDAEGLPAYLESSKASNVPYYERFGFRVTGEHSFVDGPTMWFMWRDPR